MEGGSLQSKLAWFLFRYRITPHTTTGLSPAEVLMSRRPRSLLDLVHPDTAQRVQSHQEKCDAHSGSRREIRSFQVMDQGFMRDFQSKRVKWMLGEIVQITGPLSYQVRMASGTVRRHVDNISFRHLEEDVTIEPEVLEEAIDEMWWPTQGTGDPQADTSDPPSDVPEVAPAPAGPLETTAVQSTASPALSRTGPRPWLGLAVLADTDILLITCITS